MRRFVAFLVGLAVCAAVAVPAAGAVGPVGARGGGGATTQVPGGYAPLDRPGPALDVPPALLAASLSCSPARLGSGPTPVLLVPGTTLDPTVNFSWNYERAFTAAGRPWCAVTLPGSAMGDVQTAGEYVVSAIRTMAAAAGRRIDILGYSQGGMVPRWALRFWPDTRARVDDLVALDPSNHGTLDAYGICATSCSPAIWQQRTGSQFLAALNSGAEVFPGISYTVVYSRTDEVVVPNLDASGSSALHPEGAAVVNIAVQQICPADTSEHLAMGTFDPVGYALAVDAFGHRGPADASRIPGATCLQGLIPGVAPATFAANFAAVGATAARELATAPRVAAEPPLAPYVYAVPPTR